MRMRSRPMPACVVLRDDVAGLRDGGFGVVGEARVDFGGDAAGNDGENLFAEGDGQALEGEVGDVLVGGAFAEFVARILQHAVDDGLILRHLRGGGDERGIGGGVLRMEFLHGFHVAGIGDDDGVLAQLFQQILRHDSSSGEGAGLELVVLRTSVPLLFKMR